MEKALVELTNGDLVEINLPSLTDVLDFVISVESRDDEVVYEAILPSDDGISLFTEGNYLYDWSITTNEANIALVYSGERYAKVDDFSVGANLVRFYDLMGAPISNEIIFTDQTDQGHRPNVHSISADEYLLLFQTNNPIGLPRLEDQVGYGVGRVIDANTYEMDDTFVIAEDVNLLATAPEISTGENGEINIFWEEFVLEGSLLESSFTSFGGDISDLLFGLDSSDILYGFDGDDEINGLGGDDIIDGGDGADSLVGGDGDDIVDGGDGDDLIVGGSGLGDDEYFGGFGADTIKYTSATAGIQVNLSKGIAKSASRSEEASIGIDKIFDVENIISGRFDDLLSGNSANNSISGGTGNDILRGKRGNDLLKGGRGDDNIKGNGGSDVIKAGGGADTVKGGGGADVINGGGGSDLLQGGGGNDTITGKGGDDTLKGNGGADVFQFRASNRNDTILDFRQGQDLIEIQNGANSFAGLSFEQDGQDVLIGFGAGQVRVMTDSIDAFDESDFIF